MIARSPWISALGVVGLAAFLGACDFGSAATGETRTETVSFDLDNSKSASVDIRMGAGELNLTSGTGKMMEGTFAFNVAEWRPVVDYRAVDTVGTLSLRQSNTSSSFGNVVNNWDVKLNRDLPLELKANLGAGEAHLKLGELNLSRVELNIGAGAMEVDLRGEPKRGYSAQIRGGVGETVVYLPKDVAISATASKGIGAINVEGLEQRDGVWINPERVGAPVTVRLDVKGGVGEIRIVRDR